MLSLLQQITDEASQGKPGDSKLGADRTSGFVANETVISTQPEVVGPSTEELESVKELIKFDHVYYKTQSATPVTLVKQETECVKEDTIHCDVNALCKQENDISMEASDLVLEDLETLLVQAVPAKPRETTGDVSQGETIVLKPEKLSNAQPKFVVADIPEIAYPSALSPEQSLGSFSQPVMALSPLSVSCTDSGYSDSSSDVDSPCSSMTPALGDDPWEDSFTDLFPDLL